MLYARVYVICTCVYVICTCVCECVCICVSTCVGMCTWKPEAMSQSDPELVDMYSLDAQLDLGSPCVHFYVGFGDLNPGPYFWLIH